jgi:hypothetical protein
MGERRRGTRWFEEEKEIEGKRLCRLVLMNKPLPYLVDEIKKKI